MAFMASNAYYFHLSETAAVYNPVFNPSVNLKTSMYLTETILREENIAYLCMLLVDYETDLNILEMHGYLNSPEYTYRESIYNIIRNYITKIENNI